MTGMADTAVEAYAVDMSNASSYRVKFERQDFLDLVDFAKPKLIYKRGNMHFFAFDGFVMYSMQCQDKDFAQRILETIEFSNQNWTK
jgi:hypothetical protein